MGSIGLYTADFEDELELLYCKCKKNVFESYLSFESSAAVDESILIQEKIFGQEFGVDVIHDLEANFITCMAKEKIEMRAGETFLGKMISSKPFMAISKKIGKLIGHQGVLSLDLIGSEKQYFLIEMNCRISGHYPVSHCAGANFPRQLIQWLQGYSTDPLILKQRKMFLYTRIWFPKLMVN